MKSTELGNLKVLVIIPAYNEEKNISNVIRNINTADIKVDVVVVNDGSADRTAEVAKSEGVKVLSLPYNLGIGGAMQTGYLYAKENDYDIAIQLDGDGQHDPVYIKSLVEPVAKGLCDMAIGSRYVQKSNYKSSVTRRMGMIFFSGLVFLLTGKKITDTTSGFRAVNKDIIRYFAQNYPSDYPEVDVLIRLYKKKFKVMEVPVEMKERQGGTSSITPVKSVYYMIKVSMVLLINSLRSGGMS
jgi:glycosyltransferase involved in cell wall biosynthesis